MGKLLIVIYCNSEDLFFMCCFDRFTGKLGDMSAIKNAHTATRIECHDTDTNLYVPSTQRHAQSFSPSSHPGNRPPTVRLSFRRKA